MAFPVETAQLRAAEVQLGRQLPAEHFFRLAANNGGEIAAANDVWQLHPVWDATDRRRMGRTANHIVRETQSAKTWPCFSEGAIAIASNGTGDLRTLAGELRRASEKYVREARADPANFEEFYDEDDIDNFCARERALADLVDGAGARPRDLAGDSDPG